MEFIVDDNLLIILREFNLSDLVKYKLVSKRWNKLISSNYQDKGNGNLSFSNVIKLENRYSTSRFRTYFGDQLYIFCADCRCQARDKVDMFRLFINEFNYKKDNCSNYISFEIDDEYHKESFYERFRIKDKYFSFEGEDFDFNIRIEKNEIMIFKFLFDILKESSSHPDFNQKCDCRY